MNTQKQQQNAIHQLHDVLCLLDLITDGQTDEVGPQGLVATLKFKIENVLAHMREGSIQHAVDDQRLSFSMTSKERNNLELVLDILHSTRNDLLKSNGRHRENMLLTFIVQSIADVVKCCYPESRIQTVDPLKA